MDKATTPFVLQPGLYSFRILSLLDFIANALVRPCFMSFDQLLSCFLPTTAEQSEPISRLVHWLLLPWFYLTIALLTSPIALIGFITQRLLLKARMSYKYYEYASKPAFSRQLSYSVASANVVLMPESLSRYNNESNNTYRAWKMAAGLTAQQVQCCNGQVKDESMMNGYQASKPLGTATEFPKLDIICFQEVFDRSCQRILLRELGPVFPYIVYDARSSSVSTLLNSGLMIASRHAITHAHFTRYGNELGSTRLLERGVLMCKVNLGHDPRTGKSAVGYVSTTHLQPYATSQPVVRHQLTALYQAVSVFRAQTESRDEHVLFDVVTGDLNFDNTSPGDSSCTNHPLFSQYVDVCRVAPGIDHKWAVGTERRHRTLHHYEASHPAGLKAILDDPAQTLIYVFNADIKEGEIIDAWSMPERDEDGEYVENEVGGLRRIDYCLYNRGENLVVTGFNFVTQFASLTDHIPVVMTIMPQQF